MLVVVKKPPIDFKVEGSYIPESLLETLRNDYGCTVEGDDGWENADDSKWYKEMKKDETPGGNLRFYRKLHKLTQRQLAEKLGTTVQFISNVENGSKPISKKMVKQLAQIFNITPARFI
ncbi:MAG: helix-turn-helix transcriptional regulator [Sphaerochaetaceae bacterium]|jgi:DNA-binding XRE family transcriptional regulator